MIKFSSSFGAFLCAATLLGLPALASGTEVISYRYDSVGRLRHVGRSGTVNPNLDAAYIFDKANNRTAKIGNGSVPDFSFEEPEVGAGYVYQPTVSGVTFVYPSGVAANQSGWGFDVASEGDQVAFIQSVPGATGRIVLNVSNLEAGQTYTVSFSISQRAGFAPNPITAVVNGANLGTYSPIPSFNRFTTPAFVAGGNSATLEFVGMAFTADIATALDLVRVAPTPP